MSDDQDCPGRGKCHGPMKWCDRCGDVGDVCNALIGDWCDAHFCQSCRKGPLDISDYVCEACAIDAEVVTVEERMLNTRDEGLRVRYADRLKRLVAS